MERKRSLRTIDRYWSPLLNFKLGFVVFCMLEHNIGGGISGVYLYVRIKAHAPYNLASLL